MSARSHNFRSLEGLRGYMAWTVVVGHVLGLTGYIHWLPDFLTWNFINAGSAVNVFIIVSGFVITHLLMSRDEPYGPYITRRAFRIFPIYLVCLVIGGLTLVLNEFVRASPWLAGHENAAAVTAEIESHMGLHWLLHLGLVHGMVPDSVLPRASDAILGPAWSLSLEWQFYLVAPLLVGLMRRNLAWQLGVAASLIAGFLLFRTDLLGEWRRTSMLLLAIPLFLIGIFSRLYFDRLRQAPLWLVPTIGVVAAVIFRHSIRYECVVWAIFLSASILEVRPVDPGRERWVRMLHALTANRWVTWLGQVSYSTYLVHLPFLSLLVFGSYEAFGWRSQKSMLGVMGVGCVLLIPLSRALFLGIEKPFNQLGGRIARRRPVTVPQAS